MPPALTMPSATGGIPELCFFRDECGGYSIGGPRLLLGGRRVSPSVLRDAFPPYAPSHGLVRGEMSKSIS